MAKYTVNCDTCGENFTVQLLGKIKDREYKLENWTWTCDICKEKARENERKAKTEKAISDKKELGLPDLTGTEKQIAWAETIRIDKIKLLDKIGENANKEIVMELEEWILTLTSAHWWIENRYIDDIRSLIELFLKYKKENEKKQFNNSPEAKQVISEMTVRPLKVITETVAEIIIDCNTIKILFPEKRDDFREIVKNNGFKWDSCWKKDIVWYMGHVDDRASEIGNKLLSKGFIVRIANNKVRENAISGNFENECNRWIFRRSNDNNFGIFWTSGDWYSESKRITSAKWVKPQMIVKSEHFEEIEDFANLYYFKLSDGAKELIKQAKINRDAQIIVNIEEKIKDNASTLKPIEIKTHYDIDESLRDE